MSDDADITSDRAEREMPELIARAARVIPIHERPLLGCVDCSGIAQSHAKDHCGDYAACLADWNRANKIYQINGK